MVSKFSKPAIGYVTVRVFAHATEDSEKVLAALRNTLPRALAENAVFQKSSVQGHHGNPITLFETKLSDRLLLPEVLGKIGGDLTALDKETLNSEIKLHVDKGNLYLRFDKQRAYLGELRFSSDDPIHFRIHFKNRTTQEIIDICKEQGLLP